jgi:hypothetical protein
MLWKSVSRGLIVLAITAAAVDVRAQTKSTASAVSADEKEVYSFVLTMDSIQKLAAAQRDLEMLAKSDPEVAKKAEADDSENKTLDQMVRRIDSIPQVVAVLRKDGLTPREYAVSTMTLVQTGMVVGLKRNGTYKEYPPEMLKLVSPANIAFMEQHYADIAKIMPAVEGKGDGSATP